VGCANPIGPCRPPQDNRPAERLATFMAMRPERGASVYCELCPTGMNRVRLTPQPYGDARRIALLLLQRPDLLERAEGGSSLEQSQLVEAWDRGLLKEAERRFARRALERARRGGGFEDNPLERALQEILARRVEGGEGISKVVEELAWLSKDHPIEFTCRVGRELSAFSDLAEQLPPLEFAGAVAWFLGFSEGVYPRVGERKLWNIWGAVRELVHG
jgi:hypothetical protein